MRSRLTRRLPEVTNVAHLLTTWHGWTWHHRSCRCSGSLDIDLNGVNNLLTGRISTRQR